MFGETLLEVLGRSNVMTPARTAEDIDPCHSKKKVGWVGLEPTTNALKGRCSTIELPTPGKTEWNSIAKTDRRKRF